MHTRPTGPIPELPGAISFDDTHRHVFWLRIGTHDVLSMDGRENTVPTRRYENAIVPGSGLALAARNGESSVLFLLRRDASSGETVDRSIPICHLRPSAADISELERFCRENPSLRWYGHVQLNDADLPSLASQVERHFLDA